MERQRAKEQDKFERRHNFNAVEENFTSEQAKLEASRCLNCKNPRCVQGCPVNIQIPDFIKALKEGELEKSGEIIRNTSMLPSVCGRVCPQERQCEGKCILGIKSEPIAIGALERYVGDNTAARDVKIIPSGKKVAIVGSGCAGITAAADLRKAGHDVTIFEALHKFGGVLRYGIPPFRLPRKVLDKELENHKKKEHSNENKEKKQEYTSIQKKTVNNALLSISNSINNSLNNFEKEYENTFNDSANEIALAKIQSESSLNFINNSISTLNLLMIKLKIEYQNLKILIFTDKPSSMLRKE